MLVLNIRKKVSPEHAAIAVLIPIFIGNVALCHLSHSVNAPFLVFTYACVLLFGNVALPLSYRRSVLFTSVCVAIGGTSTLAHSGLDPTVRIFAVLLFASSAAYMVLATYRMEEGERRNFLHTLREKLAVEALAEHNSLLRRLSETDGLTGIGNRRSFDVALSRLWREHATSGGAIGLIIFDIDHFKRLNDTLGHLAGDQCLQAVARCLDRCIGPGTSILARYGGEEFAVILPYADGRLASTIAERLRAAVAAEVISLDLPSPTASLSVTVSGGFIVTTTDEVEGPAGLVAAADEALYQAKRMGRNRVRQGSPQDEGRCVVGA